MNLANIAAWHAKQGFSIVPCHGKRALVSWSTVWFDSPGPAKAAFEKVYTYKDRITGESVYTRPDAIGIICSPSNIVALDLDSEEAIQWARDKAKEYPRSFAQAGRVRSPRLGGGLHLYFTQRIGREPLRQAHGAIAKNVDIKAAGSLIIAPGSLHKTGNRYIVESDKGQFSPWRFPEAPAFLYDWQEAEASKVQEWSQEVSNFSGMAGTIFAQLVTVFSGNDEKAHILCPNWQNHGGKDKSGTVLYPANKLGGLGKIHCEHGSCNGLTSLDFKRIVGDSECNRVEKEIKR